LRVGTEEKAGAREERMKYVSLTEDEILATFQVRGLSRSADAMALSQRSAASPDRGMPTWQAIDGNGDGEISQIEFIKALRRDKQLAVSCAAACLAFSLSAPWACAG
jgi:hypothetical protein